MCVWALEDVAVVLVLCINIAISMSFYEAHSRDGAYKAGGVLGSCVP